MGMEKFKDVIGYEGIYQISSWGRVLNIKTKRFLTPRIDRYGYLGVLLCNHKGGKKPFRIHRLVALAFIPNTENKSQVNHLDGNKQNNSITNLEWCTNLENAIHAKKLRKQE